MSEIEQEEGTKDLDEDMKISPHKATDTAAHNLVEKPSSGPGKGEVNNAATWDEFPNGRFGDFKSPAFGAQDPWGSSRISVRWFSLHHSSFIFFGSCYLDQQSYSSMGSSDNTR